MFEIMEYSVQDANGNEIGNVRWLKIGRGKWFAEAGKWGIAARFGAIHFSLHFDRAEEE